MKKWALTVDSKGYFSDWEWFWYESIFGEIIIVIGGTILISSFLVIIPLSVLYILFN